MKRDESATLEALPINVRLIHYILKDNGRMTVQELADSSMMSKKSVRKATRQLCKTEYAEKRPVLGDARKRVYRATTPEEGNTDTGGQENGKAY